MSEPPPPPGQPEVRSGPPYVMSDMVEAQRALPPLILGHPAAAAAAQAILQALASGAGVVVTGCGTSEHAARGVAALLDEALAAGPGRVVAREAFDAALHPVGGVCIAVSHEAETAATTAARAAARRAGATTCLITAATDAAAIADLVYPTALRDASWCHSVGYVSPLLAGAAIAAALGGRPSDAGALSAHIAGCDGALTGLAGAAGRLGACGRLLAVGSGLDAISAAEQALKVEEGAWIPCTALHVEALLHGHLASLDADGGVVAYLCDPDCRPERATRTASALRAVAAVGATALLITSADGAVERDDADGARVVLPACAPLGAVGALLAGALALQRLTLALAAARGTNPDLLRRDDERYRRAARIGREGQPRFDAA